MTYPIKPNKVMSVAPHVTSRIKDDTLGDQWPFSHVLPLDLELLLMVPHICIYRLDYIYLFYLSHASMYTHDRTQNCKIELLFFIFYFKFLRKFRKDKACPRT